MSANGHHDEVPVTPPGAHTPTQAPPWGVKEMISKAAGSLVRKETAEEEAARLEAEDRIRKAHEPRDKSKDIIGTPPAAMTPPASVTPVAMSPSPSPRSAETPTLGGESEKTPLVDTGDSPEAGAVKWNPNALRSSESLRSTDSQAPWRESHRRQANQFRAKALQYMELEDMTKCESEMTRRDVLRDLTAKQRKNRNGCLVLPLNIAFFVFYAMAARLHEDITNVWLLESAIRYRISGQLENVNTIDDVWSWMKTDMMATFFEQTDEYGQQLPSEEWSRVLLYSQVQGSVILRQTRETTNIWGIPYNGTSNQFLDRIIQENRGFVSGRRLGMLRTEWMRKFMTSGATDDRKFDFELFPTTDAASIALELSMLEQRRWLDEKTQVLNIIVLLLNGELGRPRLEHVDIELQFSRGGGIYGTVSLQPLFLETFAKGKDGLMSMGADFCWVVMLICNSAYCIYELWQAFVTSTLGQHIASGIVPMEWFIMFLGWLNIIGFYMQTSSTGKVADQLKVVRDSVQQNEAIATRESQTSDLHDDVDALIGIVETWRTALAWTTLVLIFRFFAAFRVQPRLAVVTNTLKATILDLSHFLIVFTPTFLAYAISGNVLFGRRLESFSTVQGSIGICLRIAFENEFEWLDLSEEYFYSTAIWAWSFLIMVVMIMLNMVLAIVLDIYNEVRAATDSTDTIFLFLTQVFTQLRHFKAWVTHKDMQCMFAESADAMASVKADDLLEAFPNITESQMNMIMTTCKLEMMWQAKSELVASNFLKLGASIKLSVDDASNELTDLNTILFTEPTSPPGSAREKNLTPRSGGKGPSTPTPAQTPLTTPRRMAGASRPFPGVPSTPGGHFPPMLMQGAEASSINLPATSRRNEGEPIWYTDLRKKMEASGELMDAVLADLRTFHYWWNKKQRACAEGEDRPSKLGRKRSLYSLSDMKLIGGRPVL